MSELIRLPKPLDWAIKKLAIGLSPAIVRFGLVRPLYLLETYLAFLSGRGSGAGWGRKHEISAVASEIKCQDAIIFDVGANNGTWSRDLSNRLGSERSSFFLFECAPYCFESLNNNAKYIPNNTIVHSAISDESKRLTLHCPTRGSGLASLHERFDKSIAQESYERIDVEGVTLDQFTEERGINRIDLLKLDIEGHEFFALKGAARLFERRVVLAISFEFGSACVNSRLFFRDYWDFLTNNGFKLFRIAPGGAKVPIRRYTEELEYFRGATNYIARLQS